MPGLQVLFDEFAALTQLQAFVVAVLPEVPAVDVYRWRPSAVPGKWGVQVLLMPLQALPRLLSLTGEESQAAQAQRVRVVVTTAVAGQWVLRVLGEDAVYVAGGGDSAADIRDGLRAAVDALGLPVTTSDSTEGVAPGQAGLDVLADVDGVSMLVALATVPGGGAGTVTMVDDCIRRCTYNLAVWSVRVVVRDVPPAGGSAQGLSGVLAERLRLAMQAISVPVTLGLAYPTLRDRLRAPAGRMTWRQTVAVTDASFVENSIWKRGVAVDFEFDVPAGLAYDAPSLDVVQYPGPPAFSPLA